MNRVVRKLMDVIYRPLLQVYLRNDRQYRSNGLQLLITKKVFHPAFFGSTTVLMKFLQLQDLSNHTLLEIGCGSGLLSMVAAQRGALVTGVDIDPNAVECSKANAVNNGLNIHFYQSDLFEAVPVNAFDCIIVNPPFFNGDFTGEGTPAWYAGSDFYFFRQFFKSLSAYTHGYTKVWMILSEVCDLDQINRIAEENHYSLSPKYHAMKIFEQFIVYEIHSI